MKHFIIIVFSLAGVIVALNYNRIQNYLHPLKEQAVERGAPVAEVRPRPEVPGQTNPAVVVTSATMPTNAVSTNLIFTNPATNWPSAAAAHYAELINTIRAARGN
jgi:hypothetical protein